MATSDQLLRAGALLPAKGKLRGDVVVDVVSARSYQHAALEHPVIKLSSDNLAAGDDLTMEFLGFVSPDVAGPVARRQRRALGFPEWALINDPDHARYALELVKEFRREVNRAKPKPGHAQEGFDVIAKRLGKSVAHFLPSFWEQVGREFIQLGNTTYGSRAFSKAREAEKVHGLEIDEDVRRDAFLEFALAGCVSIKVLTEYGKELSQRHDPPDAWQFFRELCVRRVLGGMPPWNAMLKDMARLIKQADLDVEAELESVLQEMIDAPSINRASLKFWSAATDVVAPLAQRNPHVAGVLLNLIPKTTSWRASEFYEWCQLLDDWGVLENAWSKDVDPAAAPKGGAAAWYTRGLRSTWRSLQMAYDLLERMAPRLRKDRARLDLYRPQSWGDEVEVDADLVDLALSLRVRLAGPPAGHTISIDLEDWCRDGLAGDDDEDFDDETDTGQPRPGRLRDLSFLAADERFTAALQAAVASSFGSAQFQRHAAGKAGLTEARRQCLLNWLNEATSGTLLSQDESLGRLKVCTTATTFQEFPEAYRKLSGMDVVPALTRTLQAGLIDEYGWPALEAVVERLTTTDKSGHPQRPLISGHFPYLIVTDRQTVVVLRGDEIVLESELKLPKGHSLESLAYLDGDLVVWAEKNHETTAWWHSQPAAKSKGWWSGDMNCSGLSFDLPAGGTFVGSGTVHCGRKSLLDLEIDDQILEEDGRFWTSGWSNADYEREFREVDPATGKRGRVCVPGWLDEYITSAWKLLIDSCSFASYGDLVDGSPLGSRNGKVGFRARYRKNATEELNAQYEGIDGRSLEYRGDGRPDFRGLLQQPGRKAFLPVDEDREVWDVAGQHKVGRWAAGQQFARGQAASLSADFLHLVSTRDVPSSRVLRKVTQKQARALLDAALQDLSNWDQKGRPEEDGGYPLLDGAIRDLLPKLQSQRLLQGLRGVVRFAAEQQLTIDKLVSQRDPRKAVVSPVSSAAERLAEEVLSSFSVWGVSDSQGALFAHMAEAAAFFAGKTDDPELPGSLRDILSSLLSLTPADLWTRLSSGRFKVSWMPFLQAWSELPFAELPGRFRSYGVDAGTTCPLLSVIPADDDEEYDEDDGEVPALLGVYTHRKNRYLVHRSWSTIFHVLEYAPDGKFHDIKAAEYDEDGYTYSVPTEQASVLHALIAAASQSADGSGGPSAMLPAPELVQELSETTELPPAQVLNLWLGCPGRNVWHTEWVSKEVRNRHKLRVKDLKAAREQADTFEDELVEQFTLALLQNPDDLWNNHQAAAQRFEETWQALKPGRLEISEKLQQEISASCPWGLEMGPFLQALVDPHHHMLFDDSVKYTLHVGDYGEFEVKTEPEDCEVFSENVLQAAVSAAALLFYRLPVGDPAREQVVSLIDASLQALRNGNLIFTVVNIYLTGSDKKVLQQMQTAFGKPTQVQQNQYGDTSLFDDGIGMGEVQGTSVTLRFRPAKLKTARQLEKLRNQVGTFFDSPEVAEGSLSGLNAVEIVRSKPFGELKKRVGKTPVPEGSYEASPLLAAATLVKSVARKLKLSEAAAAYYLQILSLPDPTDQNVKLWNGWSTAQVKAIAKELVSADLVIAAKRSRAGRSVFLPGGWEALKSPLPPIETWKMPLFGMTRDHYGRAAPPLSLILPLEPLHLLFARAWDRVQSDDAPQYESVNQES
ncbi:MAG: hypothetical protein NXI04_03015 [Planctomycetaceae bacterium]|nr:hypothetical protein [Planctomycetaceae bacterium]